MVAIKDNIHLFSLCFGWMAPVGGPVSSLQISLLREGCQKKYFLGHISA